MDEVRREAIDRLDQALMTIEGLMGSLPSARGKKGVEAKERLLGLQEDVKYARSVLERLSIPFLPNR